jgi:site-specific DNA recombinase
MAKHEFFKKEFDKLAINGMIGDPNGEPGYSYLRVSSDEQGEEGRSGLPRQIEHVHEIARQKHISITWDRVFADDFTGFELQRPELDKLRAEYRSPRRQSSKVVIEYLDRLSRNADWHQGFLLDEMKKAGIEAVFWKSFTSRIERIVMGVISQDGMELSLERMADGTRKKAESGRVTAHRATYGYKFVDDHGNESERARKHTYYAIREDEAAIIRLIYQRVASGDTLVRIAQDLHNSHVPTPKRTKMWIGSHLNILVHNEAYKGDFIAHRWHKVEIQKPTKDGMSMRMVKVTRARSEEEWIHVPVPAIVDEELWQAANDMLEKNKQMARRNATQRYLLTGLIRCAECGSKFSGKTVKPGRYNRLIQPRQNYSCRYSRSTPHYVMNIHGKCSQGSIAASFIEPAVWTVVCNALLNPDVLLRALEADVFNEYNANMERQIDYLRCEIEAKKVEDDKLYRAYVAGVFDEVEYAERRRDLKAEGAKLAGELDKLLPQRVSIEQFEAQRELVLEFSARLRAMNAHVNPPFELKQRILKMTVDKIILNKRERWFRLEGVVRGTFDIANSFTSKFDAANRNAGASAGETLYR